MDIESKFNQNRGEGNEIIRQNAGFRIANMGGHLKTDGAFKNVQRELSEEFFFVVKTINDFISLLGSCQPKTMKFAALLRMKFWKNENKKIKRELKMDLN